MPRRGDHIHKRKDGRWEGRYPTGRDCAGHVLYSSVYGHSYGEVKQKLKTASFGKNIVRSGEKTLSDVLELWLDSNRVHLKKSSQDKYEYMIRTHIDPLLGTIKISKVSATSINGFLASQLESGKLDGSGGLSASYVKTMMILLQAAMQFAVSEKLCPPLNSEIHCPSSEKQELTLFSREERETLERFLISSGELTALGILLSLYTGLRIGEICALRWSDIDFGEKTLTVRKTTVRIKENGKTVWQIETPKTQASCRKIPLTPMLLSVLQTFYTKRCSPYVVSETKSFVNPRTYDYRYHAILKRCGISALKYHTLRHTFASYAIECGMDVKTLSELLGHADSAITLRTYVHTSMAQKRSQMEKIKYLTA